ncbi:MAG: chemotaxis protein CheA, partial [Betaproteobacteria bacterium]|nr:chemotaxis protein CheA [Betaproteobacteria bacterium]
MSAFTGMEELLQDFLQEALDLLSDVDNKLVELEQRPNDAGLLNDIFRGFHTIKGGAGFLGATEMVALCHRTENLFDQLRQQTLELTPLIMDVIMLATAEVRNMMGTLSSHKQPDPAPADLLAQLDRVLQGESLTGETAQTATPAIATAPAAETGAASSESSKSVDWGSLLAAVSPAPKSSAPASPTESA